MAGGSFIQSPLRFQVESTEWVLGLREELNDDEFDLRLQRFGSVPELDGAPIASWLLARLGRMTDDGLSFPLFDKQRNDGGGWCSDFVVYDNAERPIAAFQFQADMQGAAVIGNRSADVPSDTLLDALAAALMAVPTSIQECRLTVIDPDWKHEPDAYHPVPVKGSRNTYGWDGAQFFGRENIREAE